MASEISSVATALLQENAIVPPAEDSVLGRTTWAAVRVPGRPTTTFWLLRQLLSVVVP